MHEIATGNGAIVLLKGKIPLQGKNVPVYCRNLEPTVSELWLEKKGEI
jgi:hypothetical protein